MPLWSGCAPWPSPSCLAHAVFRGPWRRYEKDMLAFTGCDHGLGGAESNELRVMRLAVARWRDKEIDGAGRRRQGLCPLTPREAALLLRALGFARWTTIYIASGPVFGSRGLTVSLQPCDRFKGLTALQASTGSLWPFNTTQDPWTVRAQQRATILGLHFLERRHSGGSRHAFIPHPSWPSHSAPSPTRLPFRCAGLCSGVP